MSIESYRDLEVWRRSRRLVKEVYELTARFPGEERFGLVSQIRRAAISVPANLAEGGRHYRAEFIQFIRTANGSRVELETHLLLSMDLGFATEVEVAPVLADLEVLGRQLLSLERSLSRRMTK